MAKKFGGAKQKCMQRIRWDTQFASVNLLTFNLIFLRSNLQMGKAKEGLGEGGQNGDLPDRRREKTENEESDVVGEEQQRMNRLGHQIPQLRHNHKDHILMEILEGLDVCRRSSTSPLQFLSPFLPGSFTAGKNKTL